MPCEIDLVLEGGGAPWAIEIKLTTAPSATDLQRLNRAADLIGAGTRVLLSRTPEPAASGQTLSTDLPGLLAHLAAHWH